METAWTMSLMAIAIFAPILQIEHTAMSLGGKSEQQGRSSGLEGWTGALLKLTSGEHLSSKVDRNGNSPR